MLPTQTAPSPGAASRPVLPDVVKHIIVRRMVRHEPPQRIAALIEQNFQIKVDREQMLACWTERNALPAKTEPAKTEPAQTEPSQAEPTQTGPRQEKESMQIPTEATTELVVPRMACADVPEPIAEAAAAHPQDEIDRAPVVAVESDPDLSPTGTSPTGPSPTDTSPTQAEAGQEEESDMALTNEVREFIIEHMARRDPPWLIARALKAKFGLAVDREEIIVCWQDRDALPTQTGPRQEKESMPILNDEIKEFIVKRIACYETPSRIAAAVRINFGIDIDRRQVFEYNPAGSRPPAQRWIDLHAQTRARFLREVAEIGIAQKAIRLRMLDRFAQMAEDGNHHDKAAKFLEQAARECGGFYEKQPRMPAPTSRNTATESESSP